MVGESTAQSSQVLRPAVRVKLPLSQSVHVSALLAPTLAENLPAAHRSQLLELASVLKVPSAQAAQT